MAGKLGVNWLNIFGLIIVILMLIPKIIYVRKFGKRMNKCANKGMDILEKTGRYVSIVLTAVDKANIFKSITKQERIRR